MDPKKLVTALEGGGEAAELCREALLAGAELEMLPGLVRAEELSTIYRRRAEHLRATGTAAIGADAAADQLERTTHVGLLTGKVDGGHRSHLFQLFLDPSGAHVVACLAVPHDDSGAT